MLKRLIATSALLAAVLSCVPAKAVAADQKYRPLELPNVHAFTVLTCSILDLNNNPIKVIDLKPETMAKLFSEGGKPGDEKVVAVPNRPTVVSYSVTVGKSRRDELDVLRYSETLSIQVARQGAHGLKEIFQQSVYVGETADAVIDLRLPTEQLFITCQKTAELVDVHRQVTETGKELEIDSLH